MNPSKRKGTAAETAVTRYCIANGFPDAERRALHGNQDQGDIKLCRHGIIEVKAGVAAQTASHQQIQKWWGETDQEVENAGAEWGLLVVQRRGLGLSRVQHWTTYHDLFDIPAASELGDVIEYLAVRCDD